MVSDSSQKLRGILISPPSLLLFSVFFFRLGFYSDVISDRLSRHGELVWVGDLGSGSGPRGTSSPNVITVQWPFSWGLEGTQNWTLVFVANTPWHRRHCTLSECPRRFDFLVGPINLWDLFLMSSSEEGTDGFGPRETHVGDVDGDSGVKLVRGGWTGVGL